MNINKILKKTGYQIIKDNIFHLSPIFKVPPSRLNLLSICIESIILKSKDVFIMQVGASDGITNDPLHELIYRYDLKAIIIEPEPISFLKLKNTYSKNNNIILENCAISQDCGKISLFRPTCSTEKISSLQLTSSKIEHLMALGVDSSNIEKIEVQSLTIEKILAKHLINKIDVLQVDVEGMDGEIVESALNLKHLPTAIHFEHIHINAEERALLLSHMAAKGYEFAHTGMDTLAMQSGAVETGGMPLYL